MELLMIFMMISLMVSTRTSKQLYLIPYHLSNGPIVPYLPYWTQYGYPIPAVYAAFGQPYTENNNFVKNQMGDIDSTSLIGYVQTPEDKPGHLTPILPRSPDYPEARQRQSIFSTLFLNFFFGREATACPLCPSCPNYKPCQVCSTLPSSGVTTFTTCEANGFSSSPTGTIILTGLTTPTQVCLFTIGVQLAAAAIEFKCPSQTLGDGGNIQVLLLPSITNIVTVTSSNTVTALRNSAFIRVTVGTVSTDVPGSATCTWALTRNPAFTRCLTGLPFSSAPSGTIKLTLTTTVTEGNCDFNIGSTNTAATIKVSCATKDLVADGSTVGDVTAIFETSTTPLSVTVAGVISTTNAVRVRVVNSKPVGIVDCAWQTILPD